MDPNEASFVNFSAPSKYFPFPKRTTAPAPSAPAPRKIRLPPGGPLRPPKFDEKYDTEPACTDKGELNEERIKGLLEEIIDPFCKRKLEVFPVSGLKT